jgi:hypothetical protein
VDAIVEAEVSAYVDRVAANAGSIDVVFNGIGPRAAEAGYATPSTTLAFDKFLLPPKRHRRLPVPDRPCCGAPHDREGAGRDRDAVG